MLSDALGRTIAALYDSVFQIPFEQFRTEALTQAGEIVRHDGALWAAGVQATESILSMTLVGIDPAELMEYQRRFYGRDYVLEMAIANPGLPIRREDFGSEADHEAMAVPLDFSWASEINHAMITSAHDQVIEVSEVISLYRNELANLFSDEERERMRLLFPHLIAAWRHRQLLHLYEAPSRSGHTHQFSARGHAVVDDKGMIHAADSRFSRAMAAQFPDRKGPFLPPPITGLLTSKIPYLSLGDLEFLLTRGDQHHVLSVAVAPGVELLSLSERRVAGLFAEGHGYKAIAEKIGVSQFTVRNQISAVYRKLGVHSKVELAKAIR